MTNPATSLPGVFGKLPVLGDFVSRRLPAGFVDPWHDWMSAGLAESRARLGESWLAHYLISPIWRFAIADGLCGEWPAAGALVPSVDAVNRHYPLTVAAVLPKDRAPFTLLASAGAWYDRCEEVALACLRPDFDLASLEGRLDQAGPPPEDEAMAMDVPVSALGGPDHIACEIDLTVDGARVTALLVAVAEHLAGSTFGRYSLWWTAGSDELAPSFHVWRGLPSAGDFVVMLCDRSPPEARDLPGAAGESQPTVSSQPLT
jgi:type VI secretion system protein ImpM